jgi:hypothetical protein
VERMECADKGIARYVTAMLGALKPSSRREHSVARHHGGAGSGREAAGRETTARPTLTLPE